MNIIQQSINNELQTLYSQIIDDKIIHDKDIDYKTIESVRNANYVQIHNLHTKYKKAINIIFETAFIAIEQQCQETLKQSNIMILKQQNQLSELQTKAKSNEDLIRDLMSTNLILKHSLNQYTNTDINPFNRTNNLLVEQYEINEELLIKIKGLEKDVTEKNEIISDLERRLNSQMKMSSLMQNSVASEQINNNNKSTKLCFNTEQSRIDMLHSERLQLKLDHESTQYKQTTKNNYSARSVLKSRQTQKNQFNNNLDLLLDSSHNGNTYNNPILDLKSILNSQNTLKQRKPKYLNDIYLYKNRLKLNNSIDYYYQTPPSYRFNVHQSLLEKSYSPHNYI